MISLCGYYWGWCKNPPCPFSDTPKQCASFTRWHPDYGMTFAELHSIPLLPEEVEHEDIRIIGKEI